MPAFDPSALTLRDVSTSRGSVSAPSNSARASIPLFTLNRPHLSIWVQQTSPAVVGLGCTCFVQFSVRPLTVGPSTGVSDEWLTLPNSLVILDPAGTPALINAFFPASKIRLVVAMPANEGEAPGVVSYVLGCSG